MPSVLVKKEPMNILQIHPAYGRRYPTMEAAIADWNYGKDFSCTPQGGPYVSIHDLPKDVDGVMIMQILPNMIVRTVMRAEFKSPTCECGADLRSGEIVCNSCRQHYQAEAREDHASSYPRSEFE